jgi:thiamine pyrophosphokinase
MSHNHDAVLNARSPGFMKRALILANGKPPGKRLFQKYYHSADWFVCADGGANTAARYNCTPDSIIGDLDSVKKETLVFFSNVDVKKLKDQDSTDLEKALSAAIRKKCKEIIVLGATGGRLDHAIGNLSALSKFSRKARIIFIDHDGKYFSMNHSSEFNLPIGTTLSLVPLSRCSGIVTKGLKWNLKNESLELGVRESTSNVIVSSPATIKFRKGKLIVFVKNV